MATIRVREWTKARIEEIQEAESHSSHDSVIKSLLKDREMAQLVADDAGAVQPDAAEPEPPDTAVDGMTVLAELVAPRNGILFLWCPNCENEVAHLTVETPVPIDAFEVECQRCLTGLDQHALVAIDIGYPLEQRLVEDALLADLRTCVVDYWDRTLAAAADPAAAGPDPDEFVWRIDQYVREFTWEWPDDVPAVALEVGATYRDRRTGEHLEVVETVSENRTDLDSVRVRRYADADAYAEGDGESDVLDPKYIKNKVINRDLVRVG